MMKGFKKGVKNTSRECYIKDHVCHVPLHNGQEAICDEDRFDEVNKYSWHTDDCGYVVALVINNGKHNYKRVRLHKLLYPEFKYIDHINNNRLDNRSCNLRECSRGQNNMNASLRKDNTSGYKGVCLDKISGKWKAQIQFQNKTYPLGKFSNSKEAALAYNKAAIEYFGEFAKLNELDSSI